ncbi:hypothetical protein HOY80DRAFT_1041242 [Tuber brumale]|nr:hypothetical protein HOY80DRAFT_1041242 [Tuber brumale]
MVGEEHQDNSVVVGGAALLLHGYPIFTNDADLAITADSLHKFETLAKLNSRFSQNRFGEWSFESGRGFRVNIDLLDKTVEGGCLRKCNDYCLIDGMPMATLVDLAIAKGGAWIDRQNEEDLYGFSEAKREALDDIMVELQGMRKEREFLQAIRTLL